MVRTGSSAERRIPWLTRACAARWLWVFAAARAELRFIALTHNLLELCCSRSRPEMLAA